MFSILYNKDFWKILQKYEPNISSKSKNIVLKMRKLKLVNILRNHSPEIVIDWDWLDRK